MFRIRRRRFKEIGRFLRCIVALALLWSLVSTPRVPTGKAVDPNHADRFVTTFAYFKSTVSVPVQYIETRFNGFGSQFLRVIDAAAVAQASHARFDIIEGRYWNYGCAPYRGWSCYFNRKRVHAGRCTDLALWPTSSPTCIRVSSATSMRRAAALLAHASNGTVTMSRQLAHQLWQLNRQTKEAVLLLLRKSGVLSSKENTLGSMCDEGTRELRLQMCLSIGTWKQCNVLAEICQCLSLRMTVQFSRN